MGVCFTPSLSWATTHTKLGIQAKKSILSIKQYQKSFGYFPIKEYFKLFDSLVKPVLCYASQVWGYCYVDTIESVQNDFCKRYLCVKKTTNNSVALGECGRLPLCVFYMTNCVKYWCKLLTMQRSRYPRQCYLMLKSHDDCGRSNWASKVKDLLYQYGFGYAWITQEIGDVNIFIKMFKQRLIDCYTQNWHDDINMSSR